MREREKKRGINDWRDGTTLLLSANRAVFTHTHTNAHRASKGVGQQEVSSSEDLLCF